MERNNLCACHRTKPGKHSAKLIAATSSMVQEADQLHVERAIDSGLPLPACQRDGGRIVLFIEDAHPSSLFSLFRPPTITKQAQASLPT